MVADMRFPPFFVHARPVGSIHRPGACARLARAGKHHAKSLGRIEAGERQPSRRRRHGHGHDPQPGQMAAPNDGLAPDPVREVLSLAHRLEHGYGHGGRSDGWPPPEHHSPAPTRLFPRKREGDHFSSFFSNPTRPKRAVCGRARRAALFARGSWRAPQRSPLVESPRRRPRATPRRPTDALSFPTPQHPRAPPFFSSPPGPRGATAPGTPASTAAATDAQDPDPHEGKGPGPNRAEGRDEAAHTSTPRRAESQRTSARERRGRRAPRGGGGPPPARPRPRGPAASAPTAQPEARAAPPRRTAEAAEATQAQPAAGSDRGPQNPTAGKESPTRDTGHPQGAAASRKAARTRRRQSRARAPSTAPASRHKTPPHRATRRGARPRTATTATTRQSGGRGPATGTRRARGQTARPERSAARRARRRRADRSGRRGGRGAGRRRHGQRREQKEKQQKQRPQRTPNTKQKPRKAKRPTTPTNRNRIAENTQQSRTGSRQTADKQPTKQTGAPAHERRRREGTERDPPP